MRLDYVVSGTSYMRLSNPRIATNDTTVEIVKMLINKLVQDKHNHKFSMLYNGHTESGFGERFQAYRESINDIHVDSGGLQIITQGMTITDELKKKYIATRQNGAM